VVIEELAGALVRASTRKGSRVTKAQLAAVNIVRDEFHPDWNYTIHPIRSPH